MRELSFVLVVKFDSPERRENYKIVLDYLKAFFPNSPRLISDTNESPYHRTRHINEMMQVCNTPYAAVWDIDVLINPQQVRRAVELVRDYTLVYPYDLPWCVVPDRDKRKPISEMEAIKEKLTDRNIKASVGGCFIINVDKYRACGFENENFIDWGPEDRERYWRVRILTGKDCPRVTGPIFHLAHPHTKEGTWLSEQFNSNLAEMHRIVKMTAKELSEEVAGWPWAKVRGERHYAEPIIDDMPSGKHTYTRIITRIGIEDDNKSGRLGNKLFQAAACIGYAERYGLQAVMPPWGLRDIFPNIPTKGLIELQPAKEIREPFFHYQAIPDRTEGKLTLNGYYQSEKYFAHCADKLRKYYFKPNDVTAKYAENVYNDLSNNGELRLTVIQVRRDDYLKKAQYHTVQPVAYYDKAMEMLKDVTDKFVIFCDKSAEAWCAENLKPHGALMEIAPQDNYIGDIFVMSKCNNFIIANSTFGWWGAWLNPNQSKIEVIVPLKWFGPAAGISDKDLIPARWIRL
jgi:hypothetical protein